MTNSAIGSAPGAPKSEKRQDNAAKSAPEPIIIDMGKKSRKQVRKLRKGKPGRLLDRVSETVEHLREAGTLAEDAQPIVIVVKQKTRRRGRRIAKMWGLG